MQWLLLAPNIQRLHGGHEKMPTLPTFSIHKVHPPHSFTSYHCCRPFCEMGIDFMQCNPTSANGNGCIIVVMDYFTKWVEAMPTYAKDGKTIVIFLVWPQLRKSSVLGIFGPQYSNIFMRGLTNSHPVINFILKIAPTLLLYTPSLQLALLPSGVLILCIVILPQPGGIVTTS